MNRNFDDDNFETVTIDGKPTRILKDRGRIRVSMTMRDAAVGTGSHAPRGEVEGDQCTINGREGRLRNVNGELQCVPVKSQDAVQQFTDGHSIDQLALQRPGYRIPVVNDRRRVTDAYRRVELGQAKAYRLGDSVQCSECFGSGEDEDGGDCPVCNGSGVMPDQDSRTGKGFGSTNEGGYDKPDRASDSRQEVMDQHRQRMSELYDAHDRELANAWRGR